MEENKKKKEVSKLIFRFAVSFVLSLALIIFAAMSGGIVAHALYGTAIAIAMVMTWSAIIRMIILNKISAEMEKLVLNGTVNFLKQQEVKEQLQREMFNIIDRDIPDSHLRDKLFEIIRDNWISLENLRISMELSNAFESQTAAKMALIAIENIKKHKKYKRLSFSEREQLEKILSRHQSWPSSVSLAR